MFERDDVSRDVRDHILLRAHLIPKLAHISPNVCILSMVLSNKLVLTIFAGKQPLAKSKLLQNRYLMTFPDLTIMARNMLMQVDNYLVICNH